MNDELERIWKEAVVAIFKILSQNLFVKPVSHVNHENSVMISSFQSKI
jgi:hypothetical protein